MTRYALLLKGVNVGGKKKIAMAELRELLAGLGHTDVRTLLNSGNAVFDSPSTDRAGLLEDIERVLAERYGTRAASLLRTGPELATVIAGNPLLTAETNGSRMLTLFLSETLDPDLLAVHDPTALDPAAVRLGDGVIYQSCPDGILKAPDVSTFVEKRFKIVVTGRNWNTVHKLHALLAT